MPRHKGVHSPAKRPFISLLSGTPGPHEEDRRLLSREENFPGSSPRTTANIASLRKSLFKRSMASEDLWNLRSRKIPVPPAGTSGEDTPPAQELIIDDAVHPQANNNRTPSRRRPNPPDDEDVASRIATAIERVLGRHEPAQPAVQQQNQNFRPPDIPLDPTWNWRALSALPSDTNLCDRQMAKHLQLIVTGLLIGTRSTRRKIRPQNGCGLARPGGGLKICDMAESSLLRWSQDLAGPQPYASPKLLELVQVTYPADPAASPTTAGPGSSGAACNRSPSR